MEDRNRLSGYSGGDNFTVTANGNNQLSNLSYDAAGNVTTDQFSNSFTYDAEGRITAAGSGAYVYDGDGYRVKKTASSTTTLYWPSVVAGIVDESNSSATSFGKQIYMAGLQVWSEDSSGAGKFLFQDHLGSTRITADSTGHVKDDLDYLPFAEVEANYGTGSDIHYQFTGYESDASEDSTSYATFRNLSPSMGRFNRPDPYDGSYDPTNPQSLNRYAYVINNPLKFRDPSGLILCDYGPNASGDEEYEDEDSAFYCTSQGGSVSNVGATVDVNGDGTGDDIIIFRLNPATETVIDLGTYAPRKPNCPANGGTIANVSVTSATPGTLLGSAIGSLFGPEGTAVGAVIGSSFGIGLSVSYVPSTNSWYAGWTAVASPANGGGVSASYSFVPKGQNPNSIANGTSYSVSSTTPFGPIVTKSPGSGPAVVGIAVGTHTPIAVSAGHSWCVHNCGC